MQTQTERQSLGDDMKIVRGYVVVNMKGLWFTRVFGPYSAALKQADKMNKDVNPDGPFMAIEVSMVEGVNEEA